MKQDPKDRQPTEWLRISSFDSDLGTLILDKGGPWTKTGSSDDVDRIVHWVLNESPDLLRSFGFECVDGTWQDRLGNSIEHQSNDTPIAFAVYSAYRESHRYRESPGADSALKLGRWVREAEILFQLHLRASSGGKRVRNVRTARWYEHADRILATKPHLKASALRSEMEKVLGREQAYRDGPSDDALRQWIHNRRKGPSKTLSTTPNDQ